MVCWARVDYGVLDSCRPDCVRKFTRDHFVVMIGCLSLVEGVLELCVCLLRVYRSCVVAVVLPRSLCTLIELFLIIEELIEENETAPHNRAETFPAHAHTQA